MSRRGWFAFVALGAAILVLFGEIRGEIGRSGKLRLKLDSGPGSGTSDASHFKKLARRVGGSGDFRPFAVPRRAP
jgi:hypothetical protein